MKRLLFSYVIVGWWFIATLIPTDSRLDHDAFGPYVSKQECEAARTRADETVFGTVVYHYTVLTACMEDKDNTEKHCQ